MKRGSIVSMSSYNTCSRPSDASITGYQSISQNELERQNTCRTGWNRISFSTATIRAALLFCSSARVNPPGPGPTSTTKVLSLTGKFFSANRAILSTINPSSSYRDREHTSDVAIVQEILAEFLLGLDAVRIQQNSQRRQRWQIGHFWN